MEWQLGKCKINIECGDVTEIEVDAIVNAANSSLLGGGGVDGAIHRKAGSDLLKECRTLGGCDVGEAKITGAYRLPSKYVIHTVGPVYHGGGSGEDKLLSSAYRSSLSLAEDKGLKTIAFPAISTGVYGYPKKEAAEISFKAIKDYINGGSQLKEIKIILFSSSDLPLYTGVAEKIFSK